MSQDQVKAFDIRRLPDEAREFHAQFLAYARSAAAAVRREYGLPELLIRAEYVEERSFNASAVVTGECPTVRLHAGLPSLLHFCFNNVLRQPDVLPGLGAAAAEVPYRERFDRGIPRGLPPAVPIEEAVVLLPTVSRPADDARANAAVAMTELAAAFCAFHEVGHLVGGHAGYAALHLPDGHVSEFFDLKRAVSKLVGGVRLLQVWEREADQIALVMAMSFVRTDPATRQRFTEAFGIRPAVGSTNECDAAATADEEYELFGQLLFAVKILFLYLAQVSADLRSKGAHPHPVVRTTYLHSAMRLTAVDDLGMDEQRLDQVLDAAADLADQVWLRLCPPSPVFTLPETADMLVERVRVEVEALEDYQREWQPRYIKYAWAPTSAWKERPY